MPRGNKNIELSVLLLLMVSCGTGKKTTGSQPGGVITVTTTTTPHYDSLQVKYAGYLNTSPDRIVNIRLYRFIDGWMGTPYKWGGLDQKGIDCSAFMQKLLAEVYDIHLPRTSVQQFFTEWVDKFSGAEYLAEGDLVFFHTQNDAVITHVGLYLANDLFVNASVGHGVSIANLKDPYWKKCFVAAGRVKRS
jgi:lipoprotein Spr